MKDGNIVGIIIVFMLSIFVGMTLYIAILKTEIRVLKSQAIENGFAEYDYKTGIWRWKKLNELVE